MIRTRTATFGLAALALTAIALGFDISLPERVPAFCAVATAAGLD